MTGDLIKLKHQLNQSKLDLVKLKAQEKENIFNFGNDSKPVLMVRDNIEGQIARIKDIEKQMESANEPSGEGLDIKELEAKAYGGDTEALEKLINLASGGKSGMKNTAIAVKAKQILIDLAQKGDNTACAIIFNSFGKDASVLQALVLGNSASADSAAENFAENLGGRSDSISGASAATPENLSPKMRKLIIEKLCKDVERNIHLIAKFATTYTGVNVLSDIAKDKPTTHAGRMAARALGKAFLQGSVKVSNAALSGLKESGKTGNVESVNVLTQIVKSNSAGKGKSLKALDALTEIAATSNQAGSESSNTALGSIIGIAKDPKVSSVIRMRAVENLGKLIEQGSDPNMSATDALVDLARTSNNAMVAEQARESIFKAAEKNTTVLDRSVELFNDVAKGHVPADNKTKAHAVELLAKSAQLGGPNSDKSVDCLKKLINNPNKEVAKKAVRKLKDLGLAVNKDEAIHLSANTDEMKDKDAKRLNSKPFTLLM